MAATLTTTIDNKRYTLRGYATQNVCILEVENLLTGEWYKKNIQMKYDPEYAFKLQKTQIKSNYSPEEFVSKLSANIQNNFCTCIVKKILLHMENMKEATI